jgi:hypothetical protein
MSTEFWVLLGIHLIILLLMARRISRKKRVLQQDKARLYIDNELLTSKLEYYQQVVNSFSPADNSKVNARFRQTVEPLSHGPKKQ